jgi:hypothetical protein
MKGFALPLIPFVALSLALAGCGDGSSELDACRSAMTALCDKACECTPGAACNIVLNDMGGTAPFDSRQECLDWYVGLGCRKTSSDFPPDSFFEGCETALATSQCRTDPDPALIVPAVCIYESS